MSFSQELRFEEKPDGLLLLEEGEPRYFYRTLPKDSLPTFARSNYIHPLYGLDGEVLTEDFPDDHLHHHGIFWAWHQLYVKGKRIADPWLNKGVEWDVIKTKTNISGKKGILYSETLWRNKATSEAVIREELEVVFSRHSKDVFGLIFNIKLTPLVEGVSIGGSEDAKGYGGFSARIKLSSDVKFYSEGGEIEPQNLPVKAGPWINIAGKFEGTTGIVLMGEPDNLPYYQGWILREAGSMQNMAFPGANPITIEQNESLEFRNQILVHRDLNKAEIGEFYRRFSNSEAE